MTRAGVSRAKLPAALAGGALAVLVLLQPVLGAFTLPKLASALIVVAFGVATATLQRVRAVAARNKALDDLLRLPPGTTVSDANPYSLGVFPAKAGVALDDRDAPRYVERGIDGDLRRALEQRKAMVLIFGPRFSGKSRTAFEAVRVALPDADLLYPEDAEALKQLAAVDLLRPARSQATVLWLDDLQRYLPAVQVGALRGLPSTTGPIIAVATMRAEDYEALFAGSGGPADAGKFLLSDAFGFRLDLPLSKSEVKDAKAKHPTLDLAGEHGIETGFVADWNQARLVPARPTADGKAARSASAWSDRRTLGLLALLIATVAVGLALWGTGGFDPALSVKAQLRQIEAGLRRDKTKQVTSFAADMQGAGQPSHVLVVHNLALDRPRGTRPPAGTPSDEVRIYDESGDHLNDSPSLRFAPVASPGAEPAVFSFRVLMDLAGARRAQLVGGYTPAGRPGVPVLPTTIYWDENQGGYLVSTLGLPPPKLAGLAPASPAARSYRDPYAQLVGFTDPSSRPGSMSVTGYPVQDFTVFPSDNGARLVAGYVDQAPTRDRIERFEVKAWALGFVSQGQRPQIEAGCVLRSHINQPLFVASLPGLSYPRMLSEFWKPVDPLALC